jgi:hypothetical protein
MMEAAQKRPTLKEIVAILRTLPKVPLEKREPIELPERGRD